MKHAIRTITVFLLLVSSASAEVPLDELIANTAQLIEENRRKINHLLQGDTSRIVGSRNFNVLAPLGGLAKEVLLRAEDYRKQIAIQWLGKELPEGEHFTHISITLSNKTDEGFTLLCGPGRSFPGDHGIWLTTNRERATGSTLAHEICHVVLAGGKFPPWVQEGIASRYDAKENRSRRVAIRKSWVRAGRFPDVQAVLHAHSISSGDSVAYTVSESVIEMLVERHGKRKLFDFVGGGVTQREFEAWVKK